MTEITMERPAQTSYLTSEEREPAARIRWGGIFAGTFAALGVLVLLYAFGIAVGLSGIDPQNPGNLSASGWFSIIWTFISPIVALFVGGYVASSTTAAKNARLGATYGLVVWGITTVAIMWLMGNALGGVLAAGGNAIGAGTGAFDTALQNTQQAQTQALQAAQDTSAYFWGIFATILVSLAGAIGGGVFGSSARMQRMFGRRDVRDRGAAATQRPATATT